MDGPTAKRTLRRTMRSVRRAITDAERRNVALWQHVTTVSAIERAGLVMLFDALAGEPDGDAFAAWCAARGTRTIAPAAEPGAERPADLDLIDVVIVPGLAFTRRGERLGQGGGWYDRVLGLVRDDCVVIGVCFAEQVVDELPTEPHDRRVDLVVTEVGIVDCR